MPYFDSFIIIIRKNISLQHSILFKIHFSHSCYPTLYTLSLTYFQYIMSIPIASFHSDVISSCVLLIMIFIELSYAHSPADSANLDVIVLLFYLQWNKKNVV